MTFAVLSDRYSIFFLDQLRQFRFQLTMRFAGFRPSRFVATDFVYRLVHKIPPYSNDPGTTPLAAMNAVNGGLALRGLNDDRPACEALPFGRGCMHEHDTLVRHGPY